jgi:hypothetical protein
VLGIACGNTSSGFSPDASVPDAGRADHYVPPGHEGGIHLVPDTGPPDARDGYSPPVCDVSCGLAGGTCSAGVCTINENPGGVSAGDQGALKGGGSSDPLFGWLYPYDKTVFPRGLVPPTFQFAGTGADAEMVVINMPMMHYTGFLAGASPVDFQLPATSWTAIAAAAGPLDSVMVSVTKISGGMVSGPVFETWTFAPGTIRGTIYYETYNSVLLSGQPGVMRIDPGATKPTPLWTTGGCGPVCHAASADGSTLVAENVSAGGPSQSYDLKTAASLIYASATQQFTYCALYPDGTFCMSATDYRGWSSPNSLLWDTTTGANIAASGWSITRGGTVAFSPDGKHIAFNHEDTGLGHTLAMMDFDRPSYTFSGLVDIATDAVNTLAWPCFTPDEQVVAYHAGSNSAFETDSDATGDIFLVDLATKTVVRADALDGYSSPAPSTSSYLPSKDPGLNFAPTILPEAVGGYFWVVFTSHRSYGNLLASKASADEEGQLWVAALDIGGKAGVDSTHPAFYLDGQESTADNLRGYWVRSPCMNNGSACTSGDQCCNGFCRGMGTTEVCVSPPGGCANEYEACTTSADCCDTADTCIGGFCTQPAPSK